MRTSPVVHKIKRSLPAPRAPLPPFLGSPPVIRCAGPRGPVERGSQADLQCALQSTARRMADLGTGRSWHHAAVTGLAGPSAGSIVQGHVVIRRTPATA